MQLLSLSEIRQLDAAEGQIKTAICLARMIAAKGCSGALVAKRVLAAAAGFSDLPDAVVRCPIKPPALKILKEYDDLLCACRREKKTAGQ
jgi:hypothetical protein